MAYFQRLILAMLLLASAAAHASFPPSSFLYTISGLPQLFSSGAAACSFYSTYNRPPFEAGHATFAYDGPPAGVFGFGACNRLWDGSVVDRYAIARQASDSCPANSTKTGSVCSCDTGYIENAEGNACKVFTDADQERLNCKNNATYWNTTLSWGDNRRVVLNGQQKTGKITCNPAPGMPPGRGCTAEFQLDEVNFWTKNNTGNGFTSWGTAKYDEDITLPCSLVPNSDGTSNDPPVTEIREKDCPTGQPGQINGVDVCVPLRPESETESRKVTQEEKILPDGSKQVTTTTTTTNCKDRMCMTVTDKKVSNTPGMVTNPPPGGGGPEVPPGGKKLPDGSVWSPTGATTTSGAGSVGPGGGGTGGGTGSGSSDANGSADVKTETKADFCTKNPKDKQCGQAGDGGSGFGGACKAGFQCDGEAVMCAIAQEAHKRNCQLFETESDERSAYLVDLAKGKEGKDQSSDLKGNKEINFSSADFDTSDALGGGACIGDKTIVLFDKTIVLPFSMICEILSYLGMVLVGVSYLLAGRIIIRG